MNEQISSQKAKSVTLFGFISLVLIAALLSGFLFFVQFTTPPANLVGQVLSVSEEEITLGYARGKLAQVILNKEITSDPKFDEIEVGVFVRVKGQWDDSEPRVYNAEKIRIAHKKRK